MKLHIVSVFPLPQLFSGTAFCEVCDFVLRSYYTRRKFRLIYAKVMKKSPHVHRNSSSFIRYYGNTNVTLSLLAETLPTSKEAALFDYPFNELLVSAYFLHVTCRLAQNELSIVIFNEENVVAFF